MCPSGDFNFLFFGLVFVTFAGFSSGQQVVTINSTTCGDGSVTTWNNWGSWSAMGACSAECLGDGGESSRLRTRMCSVTVGGCNANDFEVQFYTCLGSSPPVNGFPGEWAEWAESGGCSTLCGPGTRQQTRTRECDNPEPSCGGIFCRQPLSQNRQVVCNPRSCGGICQRNQPAIVLLTRAVTGSYLVCVQGSVFAVDCPTFFNFNQFFRFGFQNAFRIYAVCYG